MEEQVKYAVVPQPIVELSVDDVKKYIAPTATDKELFLFMNVAKSYGLNPFRREVHFVKYGSNPGQTVVGYESYLKRAERTGQLDGWGVELGKDNIGEKATIIIHRKDRKNPVVWTVYRHEFDTQQANWKKMPLFMLRKVAISQGFRLAFPEELGGMPYIPEEINGNVSESLPVTDPVEEPPDIPTQAEPVKPPEKKTPGRPKFDFLKVMQGLKKELNDDNSYYELLGVEGYEHSNQITERDHQVSIYKALQAEVKRRANVHKD